MTLQEDLCTCGHPRSDHSDGEDGWKASCWYGWTDQEQGCVCIEFTRQFPPENDGLDATERSHHPDATERSHMVVALGPGQYERAT